MKNFWTRVSTTFGKKRSLLILLDLGYHFVSAFLLTFVLPFEQDLIHPYLLQFIGLMAWGLYFYKVAMKYEEGFFLSEWDEDD